MHNVVTAGDISIAAEALGIAGKTVCVHSSLKSFGYVEGGAPAVLDGRLKVGCTVVVPTFSRDYQAIPPNDMRPARNGIDYLTGLKRWPLADSAYSPESTTINRTMGAIPAAVLAREGRTRGNHAICSFSAIGPRSAEIIGPQTPTDVFAPLRQVAKANGLLLLMGVSLATLTAIHLAEQLAGREPFRRWAMGPDGKAMMVATGGCSSGFDSFDPVVSRLERRSLVGSSMWRAFPAAELLDEATIAIRNNPSITRCARSECNPCIDAIAGGPIL